MINVTSFKQTAYFIFVKVSQIIQKESFQSLQLEKPTVELIKKRLIEEQCIICGEDENMDVPFGEQDFKTILIKGTPCFLCKRCRKKL